MRNDDNSRLLLALGLFFVLLALFTLPLSSLVDAASGTFTASVTVGNSAPTIYYVDPSQTLTGAAGTTRVVYVFFNASDTNGYSDVNITSALVRIRNGSEERNSSSCVLFSNSAQQARINCSITLYYYDTPGTWMINATVRDNSNDNATNTTQTLTVSNIDAISIVKASISFSGSAGTSDIAATENPQVVNNTGNLDYTSLNLTGFAFTSGSNTIDVGNVTSNTSNSGGPGTVLINNTEVVMVNSSISHAAVAIRNVHFWLDIPSGQPTGSYSAQSNRIFEAIQ